ncbi:hypothetical protein SLINC_0833 [Streptomyces lincolnensis]|uniref:Uncharacterized protein n=1 Tax=Streptomyces lincolnensis TaxID=1915 RepID=A0A1B1M3P9_STRLN|nr:hypothetical protein [Streptomyces lincolnensis]ANS63057.1 hypothetical protein SLINC_0833 [Streptomyces lincolnensis]AXG51981.1 hypothetical protein SLCG_0826 [Streptomyces lincolnensis]QMV04979.1 hypothetical protein GJU35_04450 [Streptomyces lincolnensis]
MVTIAVTGHMDLAPEAAGAVRASLRTLLSGLGGAGIEGRSCLARGADTLFAEEVLALGGRLTAIIPSRDYRETAVLAEDLARFDALHAAADVMVMPYAHAGREAYEAANRRLLEGAQRLVAVWDGSAPSGRGGGTADAVAEARAAGIPVDVIWPVGARRTGAEN